MPPVPAKSYDIFISIFEKKVAEAQARIAKMDSLMKPYEIVRSVMEQHKIKNETKLDIDPDGVTLTISILNGDRREKFDGIISEVGQQLVLARLHDSGSPAIEESLWYYRHKWAINKSASGVQWVEIVLDAPYHGTDYIEVRRTERGTKVVKDTLTEVIWHDHPWKPADPIDEIPF